MLKSDFFGIGIIFWKFESSADFSGRNRRNEEMLQPTFGELDAAYQRQQRRKELLKEKLMAKRYQEAQGFFIWYYSTKNKIR